MRSVADTLGILLVLCGFIACLVAIYDQYRFYALWRQEVLAKAPNAGEYSIAFAWFYSPFLDSGSRECNALRRRANRSTIATLTLMALTFVFMFAMHSIGVYPVKPSI